MFPLFHSRQKANLPEVPSLSGSSAPLGCRSLRVVPTPEPAPAGLAPGPPGALSGPPMASVSLGPAVCSHHTHLPPSRPPGRWRQAIAASPALRIPAGPASLAALFLVLSPLRFSSCPILAPFPGDPSPDVDPPQTRCPLATPPALSPWCLVEAVDSACLNPTRGFPSNPPRLLPVRWGQPAPSASLR